jgi:hypothetical protein
MPTLAANRLAGNAKLNRLLCNEGFIAGNKQHTPVPNTRTGGTDWEVTTVDPGVFIPQTDTIDYAAILRNFVCELLSAYRAELYDLKGKCLEILPGTVVRVPFQAGRTAFPNILITLMTPCGPVPIPSSHNFRVREALRRNKYPLHVQVNDLIVANSHGAYANFNQTTSNDFEHSGDTAEFWEGEQYTIHNVRVKNIPPGDCVAVVLNAYNGTSQGMYRRGVFVITVGSQQYTCYTQPTTIDTTMQITFMLKYTGTHVELAPCFNIMSNMKNLMSEWSKTKHKDLFDRAQKQIESL